MRADLHKAKSFLFGHVHGLVLWEKLRAYYLEEGGGLQAQKKSTSLPLPSARRLRQIDNRIKAQSVSGINFLNFRAGAACQGIWRREPSRGATPFGQGALECHPSPSSSSPAGKAIPWDP